MGARFHGFGIRRPPRGCHPHVAGTVGVSGVRDGMKHGVRGLASSDPLVGATPHVAETVDEMVQLVRVTVEQIVVTSTTGRGQSGGDPPVRLHREAYCGHASASDHVEKVKVILAMPVPQNIGKSRSPDFVKQILPMHRSWAKSWR